MGRYRGLGRDTVEDTTRLTIDDLRTWGGPSALNAGPKSYKSGDTRGRLIGFWDEPIGLK